MQNFFFCCGLSMFFLSLWYYGQFVIKSKLTWWIAEYLVARTVRKRRKKQQHKNTGVSIKLLMVGYTNSMVGYHLMAKGHSIQLGGPRNFFWI